MKLTIRCHRTHPELFRLEEAHALCAGETYNPLVLEAPCGVDLDPATARVVVSTPGGTELARSKGFVLDAPSGRLRSVMTLATSPMAAACSGWLSDGEPAKVVEARLVVADGADRVVAAGPVPLLARGLEDDGSLPEPRDGFSPVVSVEGDEIVVEDASGRHVYDMGAAVRALAGPALDAAVSEARLAESSAARVAAAVESWLGGAKGDKGDKGDRGPAALIGRMVDGDGLWHDVSLGANQLGQLAVVVDQRPAGGSGSFDADVEAAGSTAPRPLSGRFGEEANVRDFGAVGDGSADDTAALQAAIDTGRTVYLPRGDYRVTGELLLWTRGQRVRGDGPGYSYSNPASAAQRPASRIVAAHLGAGSPARVVRTRVRHRSAEGDPEDDPISCVVDVQAEGVSLENLGIWLQHLSSDVRAAGDWDVGVFVGCRRMVRLDRVSVVGAFRRASVHADVTGLYYGDFGGRDPMWALLPGVSAGGSGSESSDPSGSGVPPRRFPPAYEGPSSASVDGLTLTECYLSGARWGLVVRGADRAPGRSSKGAEGDPLYLDAFSGEEVADLRGEAGASDVLVLGCTVFAQDGSPRRMADPVASPEYGGVDWTSGDADESGGCLLVDGATRGVHVLNGHMFIRNRFMTHIAPFNVKLVKSSSDVFVGNQLDGPNQGGEFYPANGSNRELIGPENTYGKLYTSRGHTEDLEMLCSLWAPRGDLQAVRYGGVDMVETPVKRGDYRWHHGWRERPPRLDVGAAETTLGYDLGDSLGARSAVALGLRSPDEAGQTRLLMGTTSRPDALAVVQTADASSASPQPRVDVVSRDALNIYGTSAMSLGFTPTAGTEAGIRRSVVRIVNGAAADQWCNVDVRSHIVPAAGAVKFDLGRNGRRWGNVYVETGSISTSDERVKESVSAVPDEVLDAWGRVGWGQFRFRDAVAAKGDGARVHAGLVAQRVKEAFEAAGLDATRYGLLCHDSWEAQPERWDEWDEVVEPARVDAGGSYVPERTERRRALASPAVEAGDVWSVRYEEALAMEAAWQRRRADRLEERIARLERRLGA